MFGLMNYLLLVTRENYILGTPEYSVSSLNILNKSNHDILAVISQPDKKKQEEIS